MAAAEHGRPLRILFSMRNFWYVKIFEPLIRELAARGHDVHLLAEYGEGKERDRDWNDAAEALAASDPRITIAFAPRHIDDTWIDLRLMMHLGLDHLRFLEPEYAEAPKLGLRARKKTPPFFVWLADRPVIRSSGGRRLLGGALRTVERALPIDNDLARYIEGQRPDLVLITPLVMLGSEQSDVLRIAHRLGIPAALCVGSWDHLSSKALIRNLPDHVFVWNQTQRTEAIELHGVPADRITVTGAQCFDQWFDRQPTLSRDAFCRKVGLDPARPYILYVCSSLFEDSPNEAAFAARWVQALRERGDASLRDAGVLLRPHPKRGYEWEDVDLSPFENVTLWPPQAAAPFRDDTKADYFDSMFHSAAIVGLNTSALIEGGIVGRAVHTILLPEFQENQEGTLHFHYLLNGGLLRVARDLDTHLQQLASSLRDADPAVHHNRAFIEAFVRPRGLAEAATPVLADAVEQVGGVRLAPRRDPIWLTPVRAALTPVAWATFGAFKQSLERVRRRRQIDAQRQEERAAAIARRLLEKETAQRAKIERAEQERQQKQQLKARAAEARQREKNERMAQWRRQKQRQLLQTRLASYYHRLLRPFSSGR